MRWGGGRWVQGESAERQPPGFLGSISEHAMQSRQAAETQAPFTGTSLPGKWAGGTWRLAREEQLHD